MSLKGSRKPPIYMLGQCYGFWCVRRLRRRHNQYYADCVCCCGRSKTVVASTLRSGASTSCGKCRKHSGPRSATFNGWGEIGAKKWQTIRRDARRRGWAFDITLPYVWGLFEQQQKKCAISGVSLTFDTSASTASLDRIDNKAHYKEGNMHWVHKEVNLMKGKLSLSDFVSLCSLVVHPLPKKTPQTPRTNPSTRAVHSKHLGKCFNQLTIQTVTYHKTSYPHYIADCKCSCGSWYHTRLDSVTSGKTKSCGCLQYKGFAEIRGTLWSGYIESAKRRGLLFDLHLDYVWGLYLDQNRQCLLSGEDLVFGSDARGTNASLDRIDNNLGYVFGNVRWVTKSINMMRRSLTTDVFTQWCKQVHEHNLPQR